MTAPAIAPSVRAVPSTADRIAHAVRAVEPILNRVVLAGPPAAGLLMSDTSVRISRMNFSADSVFQLLSTSMIDRLGVDLQKIGFTRLSRTEAADRWHHEGGISLDLIQVQTDGRTAHELCLEYATLLTLSVGVGAGAAIRVPAAPALLALECSSAALVGAPALESEELERAILLIAGRSEIEQECAAAPQELRTIIASSMTRLAAADALSLLVRRALPDTALLPVLATRVRDRIVRMAC